MNYLKGILTIAILSSIGYIGYNSYQAVANSGLQEQKITDLEEQVKNEKKARRISEAKLEDMEHEARKNLKVAAGYRTQLQAASGDCLDMPVPAAVNELLLAITTPDGVAGVSTRLRRIAEEASDSTVEKWRELERRYSSSD